MRGGETSPSPSTGDVAGLLADPRAALLTRLDPLHACHLVGGVTRDWLLAGRVAHDWDLVVGGGGEEFAERLARESGGRLVRPARSRFEIFRVVAPAARFDIWDRGEVSLADELARRDFTINSIAVDLHTGTVHDPLDGLPDLRRRLLRANREGTFLADPLRVLRLLRFQLTLAGFRVDGATEAAARRGATGLAGVAPERIREELDRILATRPRSSDGERAEPRPAGRLRELDCHPRLWRGEDQPGGPRPLVTTHELAPGDLDDRLHEVERATGRPLGPRQLLAARHAALLLAADPGAGPGSADLLVRRGYVSKRDAGRIADLLAGQAPPADPAAERLFLHRGGALWPACAAFEAWRAESDGRRGWELAIPRLAGLAEREGARVFDPSPLLRGDEIARLLGIEAGPELGRVVGRLRRLQVTERIDSAEAARQWLRGDRPDLPPPRG